MSKEEEKKKDEKKGRIKDLDAMQQSKKDEEKKKEGQETDQKEEEKEKEDTSRYAGVQGCIQHTSHDHHHHSNNNLTPPPTRPNSLHSSLRRPRNLTHTIGRSNRLLKP